MANDSDILVFDLEATGLDTARDQIVELAYQRGIVNPVEQNVWRIKPQRPISKEAELVHGISNEDVAHCPPFKEIANTVAAAFRAAKVIVAYNAVYDITLLQSEFKRIGSSLDLSDKLVLDPLRLWRRSEPRNLEAAVARFAGFEHIEAHSALGDVKATASVLLGMREAFSLTDKSWEELAIYSDPERLTWVGPTPHLKWLKNDIVIGFGKNQGISLSKLAKEDSSYLSWILSKDFPDHVKEVISEALKSDAHVLHNWVATRFGQPPQEVSAS